MKAEDFELSVDKSINRSKRILLKKAEHYAGEVDRLENFKRAGDLAGSNPAEALFGMLNKHLVSIAMMVEHPISTNRKVWNEKITDAINYLFLLEAVLTDMGIE